MRLGATLEMWAPGERVRREPTFWQRVRRVVGPTRAQKPAADEVQLLLSAAALVGGAAEGLEAIGVTNAIALIIDGRTVFEDRQGRPDDLDALLEAMDAAPQSGPTPTNAAPGMRTLELAVEHREAGLHSVVVLSARGVHATDEASGQITIAARVDALEPRDGELDLDYHERVTRAFADVAVAEEHASQFRRFVERLGASLTTALPAVRLGAPSIEVSVVHADASASAATIAAPGPSVALDVHARYCPEPRQALIDATFWSIVRRWSGYQPPWPVIDPAGRRIGALRQLAADRPVVEPFATADAWAWDAWGHDWAASPSDDTP